MGKTPKLKTTSRSPHSRAARRATSPGLDVDKSIKSLPRPDENTRSEFSPLATYRNSGIMKKKPKPKQKSRTQMQRFQRGMERAEVVADRTERKVEKSRGKGKTIKERRIDWENLNEKLGMEKGRAKSEKRPKGDDMDMDAVAGIVKVKEFPHVENGPQLVVVDRTATTEPEDEIT